MKQVVTISRKWNNPEIVVTVTDVGIGVQMSLADFKKAFLAEVGGVATTFRKKTFDKNASEAFDRVVNGMKEETAKVV